MEIGENNASLSDHRIVWLSDIKSGYQEVVGSKAARLGKLHSKGLPVPDGFCIPHAAYYEHVFAPQPVILKDLLAKGQLADIRQQILELDIHETLQDAILTAYQRLQALHPSPVAVRSSSTAEDLPQHSFAGLYETVLNVTGEEALLNAIRFCWASYWSDEAVFYRGQLGMDHTSYGMAVLVQSMVQPKFAGVLFTCSPLHSTQNMAMIEFANGSGNSLVHGDKRAEQVLVKRENGQVASQTYSEQISSSTLHQLFSLGLVIEKLQGQSQDIEWCLDANDSLWILQTRPITSFTEKPETSQPEIPANWEQVYDEPFSVLGCDLAVQRHTYWVAAINDYHKTNFKAESSYQHGFIYRSTPWRSTGALLRIWMGLWKLIRWSQANRIDQHYRQTILPAYIHCLDTLQQQELSALEDKELLSGLNTAIRQYLEFQSTSYAVGILAVMAANSLESISHLLFDKTGEFHTLDFLTGLDNITTQRDDAVQSLGQAYQEALAKETVEKPGCDDWQAMAARPESRFGSELHTFQDTFGYVWADRYPRDPAWQINQEALMATLRHANWADVNTGALSKHAQRKQRRLEAIEAADRQLSPKGGFSARRMVFHWTLQRAESLFPHKENRNHYVYQAVMIIQKYARAIGSQLQTQEVLRAIDEVFLLTWDEIQQALSGAISPTTVRSLVENRKLDYLAGKQSMLRNKNEVESQDSLASKKTETNQFKGEPCSPGIATGTARLVHGPGELQHIGPGEIMVCRHLRPAWSPVFTRISAVVIEEGGVLSHGATLAREYGIPAVINVPGIARIVEDGSQIVVDGNLGMVLLNNDDV